MRRVHALGLLLVLGFRAGAQTCPAINFRSASQVNLGVPGLIISGLQRLPDGSFTLHAYSFTTTSATQTSTTPQFQSNFLACTGRSARPVVPPPNWTFLGDPLLGAMPRDPAAGNLLSNPATPAGLCLAVCNTNPNLMQMAVANSSFNSTSTPTYSISPDAYQILTVDLNHDGLADVVVPNPDSAQVDVFLMQAGGTLGTPSAISIPNATGSVTAAAADLNGDGNIDLAVTNETTNTITILLGNGDGTFRVQPAFGTPEFPGNLVAADVNGDSKLDLVVVDGQGIAVHFGNGDGTFQAVQAYPTPGFLSALAVADLNNDGHPDIVAVDFDNGVALVLMNAGNGTFPTLAGYLVGSEAQCVFLMDFDWDGKTDMVFASGHPDALMPSAYDHSVTVLFGNGDGTFYGTAIYPLAGATGSDLGGMAIADFNGDGKPDAIAGSSSGISLLVGHGDGTFAAQTVTSQQGSSSLAAGDFNNDENMDFVATNSNGITVYLGAGNGTFQPATQISTSSSGITGAAVGDFNGDGKLDFAVVDSQGATAANALVYLGIGDGTFQSPRSFPVGSTPQRLQVADVNGDGKLDLVVTNSGAFGTAADPGSVAVLAGNGDGTFQAAVQYPAGTSPDFTLVADLNGDGKPDLVTSTTLDPANFVYGLAVRLNQGNGGFGAADFSGDGKVDLLVGHCCGETEMGYYVGHGDGTFQPEVLMPALNSPVNVRVADLNGDGKPDALFTLYGPYIASLVNLGNVAGGTTAITIQTNPTGLLFSMDGGTAQAAPATLNLLQGTHTIAVAATQPGGTGTQYVFGNWSDGGAASHTITVGAGAATYTATFTTQYQLTISASPAAGGTVSPSSGYYNAGAMVNLSATPAGGYAFSSWSGPVAASNSAATTVTMNAAETVTANFVALAGITIQTNPTGLLFTVDGGAPQAAPAVLNLSQGNHTVAVATTQAGGSGTQYVFSSWNDGGAASHTITVGTSAAAYTASFNTQYQLTTSASPAAGGMVSPASGYYNAGAVVNLTATPAGGYAFSGWTGSVAGASSVSTTVTMTGPQAVVANFALLTATFTLDPTSANFSASAVTGTVTVTASVSTAAWTAVSNTPSFLTVTSGAAGTGNGTVGYSVAANGAGSSRIGTLTIAGQTFTVTQSAAAATAGLGFVPVTPCRVVDTRNGNGGILGAASTRNFTIVGACAIPATAQAFSLNVTVVPAATLGYLSIWPTGQAQPNVSTLNSSNGAILANAAIVPAGTGGAVSVFVTDSTHVILDINGYFAPPTASSLAFYPVTPCRVADTRTTQPLPAGGTRSFTVPSSACGIPATAQAYSLNMTAVPPGPLGYLTTWPTGQTQPNVSTANALQGQIAANAAIVPAGTNGAISVYASDAANVIVDINGYFAPPGNAGALYFYPVTPCRIADTRNAAGDLGGPSLGAGATRTFPIPSSSCGLPSTAQAYSLNMTVVPPGSLLYLSAWPAGQPLPVVSTLNDVQAQIVANAAIVPAGTSGAISVFVSDATNVIIDVNGYFGQ